MIKFLISFLTLFIVLVFNSNAQFNASGDLDTTFNFGFPHSFFSDPNNPEPGEATNAIVRALAFQPDGKVLIGGDFSLYNGTARNYIARLNADGSPDSTFNPGTGANNWVWSVALQSDGKVIIVGDFTTYDGTGRNRIARLNADGTLDATFNPGTGVGSTVRAVALQADGKVIIGGQFTSYNGTARIRIARLNADGTLDATFNPGTGPGSTVRALVLQPDGKVIIGGDFTTYDGTGRNRIARLNADGSLDATFNPGTGANNITYSVALQADGKVIIGGDFTSYNGTARNYISRLNADGSLDATFNPGTGANNWVWSLALQSDGKVIIVGDFTTYDGTGRNRIARLNADGSLDATFNPGTGVGSTVRAVALQADGKVIIGGDFTTLNFTGGNRIARLNADGTLDATFNLGAGANNFVWSLALQADGKVIIGGDFTGYNGTARNYISRLNADGTLDTTFNPGTGSNATVTVVALQPDGKVIIGGQFNSYNGNARSCIARLNADGSLDATFNPGIGANTTVSAVALQPDGKMIIGGQFTTYDGTGRNRIARLNADGSLDATFNPGTGANNEVTSLALQPDGKVIVGGGFTSYNGTARNYIARLNADGSLDATFNPGSGASSGVYSLGLQPDGKVLIGGQFTIYNGTPRSYIARLNADGTLDATFNPGTGASNYVRSIALQSDGGVIIGGDFSTYDGTPRNYIARLNADGSLDATFNPGTGANNLVWSLALQPDGKILIGGGFTSYNGTARSRIARVLAPSCPVITNTTSGSAICSGETKSLLGTAGGSWFIFSGPGSITDSTYTASASGTVYVYNELGGCNGPLVNFTVNALPSVPTAPAPAAICAGTTATITPTSGGANYRFYVASTGGSPLSGGNGVASYTTPTLSTTTTYHVASVSAAGCESSTRTAVTVTVNPLPSAPTAPAPADICSGTTATITPTVGGANYSFYAASTGGSPLTGGNGVASYTTPTLSTNTTYHVASVSAAGCESSTRTAVTVTVNPLPSAPTAPAPAAICANNTTTITPTSGGVNYRFYAASTGGSPLTGGNGVASYTTPTLSTTTTYHVASVNAAGCESSTRTAVTVTVNPLPSAPSAPAPAAICSGTTATITPTAGGANYHFYSASTGGIPLAGGNGVTSFTTPILNTNTTYYVSSISAQGCESNARTAVTVTINALPSFQVSNSFDPTCFGFNNGQAFLAPTAGIPPYSYSWSGPLNLNGPIQQSLVAGTYNITMTDGNSCVKTDSIVITQPNQITTIETIIDATCGNYDGAINLTSSGGTGTLSFLWNNGETSEDINTIPSGLYVVTITDQNGCKETYPFPVNSVGGPSLSVNNVTPVSCYNGNNGAIDVSISGTFQGRIWSNGFGTEDISNLQAGPYQLTVFDTISNCQSVLNVNVPQPNPININVNVANANCNVANGSAVANVSGGNGGNIITWSTGASGNFITGLAAGTYSVSVTDSKGCSKTKNFTVSEIGAPALFLDSVIDVNCGGTNGSVYVTATGNTSGYIYSWDNGTSNEDLLNAPLGTYNLTVTAPNTCKAYLTAAVGRKAPATPNICVVTVDSATGSNQVVWERGLDSASYDYYNIWRESTASNLYQLIGTQSANQRGIFTDTVSNPLIKSYRYKISVVDTCGIESARSLDHKTIHLIQSFGVIPNTVNLSWDDYEGFSFSTYAIYRNTQAFGWDSLNAVAKGTNSFTDLATAQIISDPELFYAVLSQIPGGCDSSKDPDYNRTRSNPSSKIFNPEAPVGIKEDISQFTSTIYPVPVRDNLFIKNFQSKDLIHLSVLNMSGIEIMKWQEYKESTGLDIRDLASGMYILKIQSASTVEKLKFIKAD